MLASPVTIAPLKRRRYSPETPLAAAVAEALRAISQRVICEHLVGSGPVDVLTLDVGDDGIWLIRIVEVKPFAAGERALAQLTRYVADVLAWPNLRDAPVVIRGYIAAPSLRVEREPAWLGFIPLAIIPSNSWRQ